MANKFISENLLTTGFSSFTTGAGERAGGGEVVGHYREGPAQAVPLS